MPGMRIGVLGCFYGCAELLPQVLEPWKKLKEEGHDIAIAAVNAQFKEYAELGFANDDAGTRAGTQWENRAAFFSSLY